MWQTRWSDVEWETTQMHRHEHNLHMKGREWWNFQHKTLQEFTSRRCDTWGTCRRYRQKPWSKRFRKKFVCELIKSVRVLPSRETKKDFQFCPKEVHHRKKNLTKCSISFWNSNNMENIHTFSVIDKLRASIYDSQTKIMRSNLYARAEPQGCNETIETERERHTGKET